MAPSCPEEVDVFTVPHSRMKELVCKYLDMLTATNFSNVVHLTTLLETLIKTFQEFIAHEQIENQFIMKKLKNKLRSLSIQNTAVCNCHKDNTLTDMLKFLQDGYKCTKKSEADRNNYGLQLRQALENFTETFLPHMEEEEEVFQPLLIQHFTFEELKQIKATVLQQHFRMESDDLPEKFVADNKSKKSESKVADNVVPQNDNLSIESLPDEVMLKVFSHLNPLELCRSAQVSKRWNSLAMDGSLWTKLYPVSWAKGDWNAKCGVYEEDSINIDERLNAKSYDEDADVDETDDWDSEAREIHHQSLMLTSLCKHLLPRVGRTIKHCDLAYSKGLTNGSLYKILSLCPNLEYIDLTQTRVSDLGFKGFKKEGSGKKLRHLDLSGCLYITDKTLQHLSSALGQIPCHMTQTEDQVTGHVTSTEIQLMEDMKDEEGCTDCREKRRSGCSSPVKLENLENQHEKSHKNCPSDKNDKGNSCKKKKSYEKSGNGCTGESDGDLQKGKGYETSTESTKNCCRCPGPDKSACTESTKNCCRSRGPDKSSCTERTKNCCRSPGPDKSSCTESTKNCSGPDKSSCTESTKNCCRSPGPDKSSCTESTKNCCRSPGPDKSSCTESTKNCCRSPGPDKSSCTESTKNCCRSPGPDKSSCTESTKNCCRSPGPDKSSCTEITNKCCRSPGPDKSSCTEITKNCCRSPGPDKRSCTGNTKNCCRSPGPDNKSCCTDRKEKETATNLHVNDFDAMHDTKFDNENTESQDRSWIKEGEVSNVERSRTVKDDLTTERYYEAQKKLEKEQDQKNLINLNKKSHGDVEDVQNIKVIQSELNPEQTELLEEFFQSSRNRGSEADTEVTVKFFPPAGPGQKNDFVNIPERKEDVPGRALEYLSLSGCYQITDTGLIYLTSNGGLPRLKHLDLSGCLNVAGEAVCELVDTAPYLDPTRLFYCDNILDGPYADMASGCQNLQCNSRVCCRCGE